MAQIELRISSKVQKETGMCEVLIRFFQGTKFNTRAKSGIFVSPEFFEYYIDRDKTEKLGVKIPGNHYRKSRQTSLRLTTERCYCCKTTT